MSDDLIRLGRDARAAGWRPLDDDRPGDRELQQAAELMLAIGADYMNPHAWQDGIARALAAVRADEAARRQAKIEALHRKVLALKVEIVRLGGPDDLGRMSALLDGEQR